MLDVNVLFNVQGDFRATSETLLMKSDDIASSGTTGTITFATKADNPDVGNGLITATLLEGADYVRSSVSTNNEASVVISGYQTSCFNFDGKYQNFRVRGNV